MHRDLQIIATYTTLRDAMLKMTEGRLGVTIVLENKKLLGDFTDGDLRIALSQEKAELDDSVESCMTFSLVVIDGKAALFMQSNL